MMQHLAKRLPYYMLAFMSMVYGVFAGMLANHYATHSIQIVVGWTAISLGVTLPCFMSVCVARANDNSMLRVTRQNAFLLSAACMLGIYMALTLLYFSASEWGLIFWSGDIGWRLFMCGLTVGAAGVVVGMVWRYVTLWPSRA